MDYTLAEVETPYHKVFTQPLYWAVIKKETK